MGLGTTTPSQLLTVAGNGLFTGQLTVTGPAVLGTTTIANLTLGAALPVSSGGTGATTTTGATANLQFLQTGTGAAARSISDKLADTVSVKDFGAKGDGVTDDSGAINSTIAAACAGVHSVYFPTPKVAYSIASPIVITCDGLTLNGTGSVLLYYKGTSGAAVTSSFTNPYPVHVTIEGLQVKLYNSGTSCYDWGSASRALTHSVVRCKMVQNM